MKVLMVCMGNICRSPMAQVVARRLMLDARASGSDMPDVSFESAGTHAYHLRQEPDRRAKAALERRGYEVGKIRSRKVTEKDFLLFDLILAMDHDNARALQKLCPQEQRHKIRLLLDYAGTAQGTEIPDPYYGNEDGFEHVLDLCEAGARGLIAQLQTQGHAQSNHA